MPKRQYKQIPASCLQKDRFCSILPMMQSSSTGWNLLTLSLAISSRLFSAGLRREQKHHYLEGGDAKALMPCASKSFQYARRGFFPGSCRLSWLLERMPSIWIFYMGWDQPFQLYNKNLFDFPVRPPVLETAAQHGLLPCTLQMFSGRASATRRRIAYS